MLGTKGRNELEKRHLVKLGNVIFGPQLQAIALKIVEQMQARKVFTNEQLYKYSVYGGYNLQIEAKKVFNLYKCQAYGGYNSYL